MSPSEKLPERAPTRITSKNLAQQIFDADLPEQYIRTIPAQSLYSALKRNGLQSSSDLIEIASIEQCRLLIDFDCWQKSYFHEDNFWEWLAVTNEDDGLALLQKLLKCFDLKIITLLISRYVNYEFYEETTDNPPSPGYYTPDKGRTWIYINLENSDRHFLMGRLLALLFETDANLFYKLLSLSDTQTATTLEEEAYQDKVKRLGAEGIPDYDLAASVNAAADQKQIIQLLSEAASRTKVVDIQSVEPLIFDSGTFKFVDELMKDISIREDLATELTYIMNCAIVYWSVEFFEYEQTLHLSNKVKGAINLGLEQAVKISGLSASDVYKKLGLTKTYQFGLSVLAGLRSALKKIKSETPQSPSEDKNLVSHLGTQMFPEIPAFLKFKQPIEDQTLRSEPSAIDSLEEIDKIIAFIKAD